MTAPDRLRPASRRSGFLEILNSTVIKLTDHFSALAANYDVVLSDVWGVTHNGIAAFPEACEALTRYRAGGGTVILITNAPRRGEAVRKQLDRAFRRSARSL